MTKVSRKNINTFVCFRGQDRLKPYKILKYRRSI